MEIPLFILTNFLLADDLDAKLFPALPPSLPLRAYLRQLVCHVDNSPSHLSDARMMEAALLHFGVENNIFSEKCFNFNFPAKREKVLGALTDAFESKAWSPESFLFILSLFQLSQIDLNESYASFITVALPCLRLLTKLSSLIRYSSP